MAKFTLEQVDSSLAGSLVYSKKAVGKRPCMVTADYSRVVDLHTGIMYYYRSSEYVKAMLPVDIILPQSYVPTEFYIMMGGNLFFVFTSVVAMSTEAHALCIETGDLIEIQLETYEAYSKNRLVNHTLTLVN